MTPTPFSDLHRRDRQTCTITIDGQRYTVTPGSAQLLDALTNPDPLAVFPGLSPSAAHLIWQARHRDSPITFAFLRRTGIDVAAQLIGLPWQTSWQLSMCLATFWLPLSGQLGSIGIDPATTPVHRTLAAVYGVMVQNMSNADATKLDDQLWAWPGHLDLGEHTPQTRQRYITTVSGARKLVRSSKVIRPS